MPESYTPRENGSYLKEYDLDRTLTQLTLPSGRNVDYDYDEGGRITGMGYDSAAISFDYNDLTDRVASIDRIPDGISYSFVYDGALPAQMTMTVSGEVYGKYNYTYDNNFNLLGLTLENEPEVTLRTIVFLPSGRTINGTT